MIGTGAVGHTFIAINIGNFGPAVNHYVVEWERDTSGMCPDVDEGSATISGSVNNFNLTGLEEDSRYLIKVTAVNAFGSIASQITIPTLESREYYYHRVGRLYK